MKTLKLFTLILAAGIIAFSCKPGDDPVEDSAQQKFAKALVGTWTATSIEKEDEDISDVYPDFEIVFTSNATNAASITGTIVASGDDLEDVGNIIGEGTWTFTGSGITSISLGGGAEISSIEFSDVSPADAPTTVTVSFSRSESGARIKGLVGDYVVVLEKE